jgi:hypothetical protein
MGQFAFSNSCGAALVNGFAHGGDVGFKDTIRPKSYWAIAGFVLSLNLFFAYEILGAESILRSDLSLATASRASWPILIVLLGAVFPRRIQDMLAHFRFENVLPACRALELAKADPRINEAKFKTLGKIPPKGERQNTWWYQEIYKAVKQLPEVVMTQKRYILMRDLAFMQAIATLFLASLSLIYGSSYLFLVLALAMYAVFVSGTRNRGNRFVQTAMAAWN